MRSLGIVVLLLASACARSVRPVDWGPGAPEGMTDQERSEPPEAEASTLEPPAPSCNPPAQRGGHCVGADASMLMALTPEELRRAHGRFDGDVPIFDVLVSLEPGCDLPSGPLPRSDVTGRVVSAEVRGLEAIVELCDDPRVRTVQIMRGVVTSPAPEHRPIRAVLGFGPFETRGPADPDVVRRQVRRSAGSLRACHEHVLRVDPRVEGTLTVRYSVGGDGKPGTVEVIRSTADAADLDACVVRALRRIRYPAEQGVTASTQVELTLHFKIDA